MADKCPRCNGSGLVPLPRGMSPGFYAFMAAGAVRRDDGTLLMLCGCRTAPLAVVDRWARAGREEYRRARIEREGEDIPR